MSYTDIDWCQKQDTVLNDRLTKMIDHQVWVSVSTVLRLCAHFKRIENCKQLGTGYTARYIARLIECFPGDEMQGTPSAANDFIVSSDFVQPVGAVGYYFIDHDVRFRQYKFFRICGAHEQEITGQAALRAYGILHLLRVVQHIDLLARSLTDCYFLM